MVFHACALWGLRNRIEQSLAPLGDATPQHKVGAFLEAADGAYLPGDQRLGCLVHDSAFELVSILLVAQGFAAVITEYHPGCITKRAVSL